jgi:Holliday junction resolvasome RuvABC ATP-dependent DNA helicase subunit
VSDVECPRLRVRVIELLKSMEMPRHVKSLYPALHKVAYEAADGNGPEAISMVFKVVCTAVGATYRSSYMDQVLSKRFKDGTFERAIRALDAGVD